MGIFKKSKDELDDILEVSEFAEPEDTGNAESDVPSAGPSTSSSFTKPKSSQAYGIEDAIALMRKLPNVNSDITITVVKKTLESANIQVKQIITDAETKETQIQDRTNQLSKEISELENRISQLNGEITELTADLKETVKVRNLLEGSLAEDAAVEKEATKDDEVWGNQGYLQGSAKRAAKSSARTSGRGEVVSYTVQKGDTLQKISMKFFGTTKKWPKIFEDNKDKLKSHEKIYPGQVIKIIK